VGTAGNGAANTALVRRIYDSKGDPAVLEASVSDDFVWDVTSGFPDGGVYHGIEGVGDFFGSLTSHVESWYAEAEEYHPAGEDRVFVVGHYRGTNNGTTTPVRFIHEWTVSDGKLARMYHAADSAIAQQVVNG
jgi:ketosteroid isomerase-like protein